MPVDMKKEKLPRKSNQHEIDTFLQKVASTPVVKSPGQAGRLIFAMDATASREPTWRQACRIQSQMFEQTAALGGLAIQLCYYRGLNGFNTSEWLSDSGDLQQRMAKVSCLGGHTQIGKVLTHALKENNLHRDNALVFVGDCMEEKLEDICQLAGQLGIHNVPVFLFHEGGDPVAGQAFRQIAKLTKGAYCPFDAGSARQLRDLLSAVAVYAAGGRSALEDFSRNGGKMVKLLNRQIE